MPTFSYSGRTRTGQVISGQMEAATREVVVAKLRSQQILATTIRAKARDIEFRIPGFGGGVADKEIAIFTRQFATMIDAGLPLVQCLEILASQHDNKTFKKVLTEIRASVEGGSTFAAALRKHPRVFTDLYTNMVEAGEAGGVLDTILNRLAGYIEKSIQLKKKVKSALIYPSTIISVAIAVVVFLLLFVIPTFKSMFEGFGAALPMPTQIVLGASSFVRSNFLYIIALVIGGVVALRLYYKTKGGRKTIDRLLLRLPVFGVLPRNGAGLLPRLYQQALLVKHQRLVIVGPVHIAGVHLKGHNGQLRRQRRELRASRKR